MNIMNTVKRATLACGVMALAIGGNTGCRPQMVGGPPIPPGHVEIHVEFKGVSTETYNKLNTFIRELAEEHSVLRKGSGTVRDVGDSTSSHGIMNDGFADQRYNPDHPVPSPEVEEAMRARLKEFLEQNKIDSDDVTLELRYGPQKAADAASP
jgi:hypothetical protein